MTTRHPSFMRFAALFSAKIRSNRSVDAGDQCRDRGDWAQAAAHYQRAVAAYPARRPIWVQLGHALKESGQIEAALSAYQKAVALPGNDGDAPLHYGMLLRRTGRFHDAKMALLQSVREAPQLLIAREQLLDILHIPLAVSQQALKAATELSQAESRRLAHALSPPPSVVFEVSDLVSYFRHSRLPTGIQRVQMEVIRGALGAYPGSQIACFVDDDRSWVRIPADLFEKICRLAISGRDVLAYEWLDALEVLTAVLSVGEAASFVKSKFLVNLGTSWWLNNCFLHVRKIRQDQHVKYIPFVHDFIPIIKPEHCIESLTQDFLSWTYAVFKASPNFLVNSRSTLNDLINVSRAIGYEVDRAKIAVVPLDADFRRDDLATVSIDELYNWQLNDRPFVLFVSTIESRKNHVTVFRAWRELLLKYGPERVPDLVCVGGRGWLNDHVYAALDRDPELAEKVRIISGLTDSHLALLYSTCLFTVYLSTYEGWGLPVTESLCYGKVPLLSDTSSLPEAGGDFACYVSADDLPGLVSKLEYLCFNTAAREDMEANIRNNFRPRSWAEIAGQVRQEIDRFAAQADESVVRPSDPEIRLGQLYRMRRNRRTRLARGIDEGEAFRSGLGWWQLEEWGCSTRPAGGDLVFSVPSAPTAARCFVRLRSPQGIASDATVLCGDRSYRVDLPCDEWVWLSFPGETDRGRMRLTIRGRDVVDLADQTEWYDRRQVSVGLGGLLVVEDLKIRTLLDLARYKAKHTDGAYAFLADLFPIMTNNDINIHALQDYLPAMETKTLSPDDVVSGLSRYHQNRATMDGAFVFD